MNTNINSNQNNQNQSNQNVDPLVTLRDYMMPQLAELRCVLQCAISSFKEGIERIESKVDEYQTTTMECQQHNQQQQ